MNYIICNSDQQPFFLKVISAINLNEDEVVFVFDKLRFKKIFSTKINSEDIIIIDVTTNWENEILSNFMGFDIAADLRRIHRVKNQIIFHSTFSSGYFERQSQSDIKFKLLYGRGSSFIRYPYTIDLIKEKLLNISPISEATLHDVVTMLCDLKGIVIDRLNHELRFENSTEFVQQLFAGIEPYLSNDQKQLVEVTEYFKRLHQSITKNDRTLFLSQKELFIKLCTIHLTQSGNVETEVNNPIHTVLLIDDRAKELEKYKAELSKDFIVITTTNGTEAIEILKKDESNNIKAIIADWRLFQDETLTYWQPIQGYEVLEYAAESGMRALFALTCQADYVVHHIRNLLGIRFSMFKKDNLETSAHWKIFKDIILEACEETAQLISNIPKGKGWTNAEEDETSLYQQYLEKRNSPEWINFENTITARTNHIWEYYEAYINGTLDESLQDFSDKFGIVLKNRIEGVLIARRICIALFLSQSKLYTNILGEDYPRINVYSCFKNKFFNDFLFDLKKDKKVDLSDNSIEEKALIKMKNVSNQLLNATLCLGIEELASKKSMLPEERNWIVSKGFTIDLQLENYEVLVEKVKNASLEKEPTAKDIAELDTKIGLLDFDTDDDD